ncbi:MAG: type II toxin-antitoxin system VapC family toxin [Solirubrobacteraceae bacterium]
MIVLDTSVAFALLRRGDAHHERVRAWFETSDEPLTTTPLALAELDHLLLGSGGPAVAQAWYEDLSAGAYVVEWWSTALRETLSVAQRHASLPLGLADASLVALAARLGTTQVATLDERHFRAVKPLTGERAFVLLPTDA